MIDIVLQGGLNEYAVEIAGHYSQLPFVNKIILSCWHGDEDLFLGKYYNNGSIILLYNERVEPGHGNRNLQIKSSYEGLKLSTTDIAVKMRNDQKISLQSMQLMYDYFNTHHKGSEIFVAGIFPTFPFHPRDHIFWGTRNCLLDLFNIPYDHSSMSDDYTKYIRSEAYICMWYYALHDGTARYMIEHKDEYLLDNSPKRNEAIALTERLKLFVPFPRISFQWPKYGLKEYHYQYTKDVYGEYQG